MADTIVEGYSTTFIFIVTLLVILFVSLLKNWIQNVNIWRKSGIPGPFPLPLVGNLPSLIKRGINKHHCDMAKEYGKTILFFEAMNPVVLTSDPELIKAITIRDFHIFDGRNTANLDKIKPFDGFLTTIKGEKWKNLRSIISSAFSSGKLKILSKFINQNCETATNYLENAGEIEVKEFYTRFSTDVICSNFFGVNVDTISEPDHPLPKHVTKIFNKDFGKNWKLILFVFFPRILGYLFRKGYLFIFNKESIDYIESLSKQVIDERRSGNVKRNDFVQMMVDHSEADTEGDKTEGGEAIEKPLGYLKKTLTDSEILATAMLFIMAGGETTATALTWLSYNLAMNPDIQDKLIDEVDTVLEKHNGVVSYESVNEMHYLSACISETQRMFNVSMTDRSANEDYEFNGVKIKKGMKVCLAFYAVAHDEEIYPDSHKFIPERERPADKFFPFGYGPRICVAQRFALLEIKVLMASILKSMRISRTEKTMETPELDMTGLTKPKGPCYLKFVKR